MNTQEMIHQSLTTAQNANRRDVDVVDMYQAFLMFDDSNRYLVGNTYGQDLNVMMPDLFWTRFMGRPAHLPEPDLAKMMTKAINDRLSTEIEDFNTRFTTPPDASQGRAYLGETISDMYDTKNPAWTHHTRSLIRLGLMDLKAANPDAPIAPDAAKDYFTGTYAHPLAWLDRLGQAGHFPESHGIWRFVTSLDPDFDYALRARCNGIRAQWSEQTRDIFPAPEFSRTIFLGATVAQALKQDTIYLPHIFSGILANFQRTNNELLMMNSDPLLVQGYMNDWIAAWQPELPPENNDHWPSSITRMSSFQRWQSEPQPPVNMPKVDETARTKLTGYWQEHKAALAKNPEWGISKMVQWLIHEAAEPEDITRDDPEDGVSGAVQRILERGDSKDLLKKINFPEILFPTWTKLSDIEDLSKVQRAELDKIMPPRPQQPDRNSSAMAPTNAPVKPVKAGYTVSDADFKKALAEFTTDITAQVKTEETPTITGRDHEIDRIVERQNSRRYRGTLITGEPGVGKSTLVIGYAQRVVRGDVPEKQKNVQVLELNAEAIMADTSLRGQAEKNFKVLFQGIMERNKKGDTNIILSIPEAHSIKGMGASMDDSTGLEQRLKKWMTNPHLPLLLDLDTDSYNRTLGKDAAFVRRCELINLTDIDKVNSIEAMKKEAEKASAYYGVAINDTQIDAIYSLSALHLPRLPRLDTALDLMDKVMNHANITQQTKVDSDYILEAVAEKANLPIDFLKKDQAQTVLKLATTLRQEITGQDAAIDAVADALLLGKSGIGEPNQPIGSFLFIGPTGVGKTELSKVLAEILTGSDKNLIRLDMSEYMEQHSVSKLIGAPPGYVGYDAPPVLTDPVHKQPYSVVLFDEIEKAHPNVQNLFLQILDNGEIKDSTGKVIDFKKTIIIATSNIGAKIAQEEAQKRHLGFDNGEAPYVDQGAIMLREAEKSFTPEFRNRFSGIITFKSLDKEMCGPILDRQMRKVNERLHNEWGITVELSNNARKTLIETGFDPYNGARPLAKAIKKDVSVPLGRLLLGQQLNYQPDDVFIVEDVGAKFQLSPKTPDISHMLNQNSTRLLPPAASNTNTAPAFGRRA